ncbi:prepilin peptidase [Marinomonas algarum]|uniref:Prepilin leader peptidase/N-methyltransferase n=1 Tax=Marinomonas algarum TaxID=2883105 RepID=A0A9X1IP87_9GAMM|nr:A24 family peptidase [Marinomonas algarum]MCB5162770.1 prepilin peptidase [Marinomonas algarum]
MSISILSIGFFILLILSLGSFTAAFSARWPIKTHYLWRKEAHQCLDLPFTEEKPNSLSKTRSHCMHCHHPLSWKELIPIFSFIALMGRCRHCKKRISFQYVFIEGAHFLCCMPLIWLIDDISQRIAHIIILSALISAATIDIKYKLLPDECSLITASVALLVSIDTNTTSEHIIAMIIGFFLITSLRWFFLVTRNIEAIGLGDAKLVAALGAWLGITALPTLLLYASVSGLFYSLAHKKTVQRKVAFGPFLIFSAILVFYSSLWKEHPLL